MRHQPPILFNTDWKETPTPYILQHRLEGGTDPLDSLEPTKRKLQISKFSNTNWKEPPTPLILQHQLKEISNSLPFTTVPNIVEPNMKHYMEVIFL